MVTLLPALLLGPIAGALADRSDRRMTMIVGDVIRGLLFLSIPLFPNLTWIFVAKFLAGVASQFWNPAAAASIPNLVPKDKLERANQLSLLMTYGTAPLAASVFSVLALVSEGVAGSPRSSTPTRWTWRCTSTAPPTSSPRSPSTSSARSPSASAGGQDLGAVHGQGHLGGLAVHPAARRWCAAWSIGMLGAFAAAGVVVGLGYLLHHRTR